MLSRCSFFLGIKLGSWTICTNVHAFSNPKFLALIQFDVLLFLKVEMLVTYSLPKDLFPSFKAMTKFSNIVPLQNAMPGLSARH